MRKIILFKRILFWVEVVLTLAVLGMGVLLTGKMVVEVGLQEAASIIMILAGYAVQIVQKEPSLSVVSILGFALFVASLFYFSQTIIEKKTVKYIIPLSLLAISLSAIGIFTAIFAALASQGAGH